MSINLQQLLKYVPFIVGFLVTMYYKKRYNESKIDDLYLYVLISGMVGARLTYAVFNVGLFKYDWTNIISISHYNLNLYGGLIISLVTFYLFMTKFKLNVQKYLNYYAILLFTIFLFGNIVEFVLINRFPFYMGMTSINEIWILMVLFAVAIVIEVLMYKKYVLKYHTPILMVSVFTLKEIIGLL